MKTMDKMFSQEINKLMSFHFSFSKSIDASILLLGDREGESFKRENVGIMTSMIVN